MPEGLEQEIDALYSLAPEGFVGARDDLARRLREAGDERAREVKSLRRPTVAAWVVNRLVRRHGSEVTALIRAGEQLREAQQRAVSGGDPRRLREAVERRRAALRRAVELAEEILEEAGRGSAATVEAVQGTLEAASASPETTGAVREGRLHRELPPPSGFDVLAAPEVVSRRAPRRAEAPSDRDTGKPRGRVGRPARGQARDDREELRAARDTARAEAGDLAQEAARARGEAGKAERAAASARREADRWQRQAAEAARKADVAERDARRAGEEADELEERAAAAGRRLEEAEARLRARAR